MFLMFYEIFLKIFKFKQILNSNNILKTHFPFLFILNV